VIAVPFKSTLTVRPRAANWGSMVVTPSGARTGST
jgi:hypothetical protein